MQTSTIYIEPTAREAATMAGLLARADEAETDELLDAALSAEDEALPAPAHELWRLTGRGGAARHWTDAEDTVIAQVEAGQLTAPEAARMLGRTEGSVRGRLGVLRRRAVQAGLRRAIQARIEQDAAKRVLAHRAAPSSGQPWTVEEDRRLQDMAAAGRSPQEIAAALHRTQGAVRYRLSRGQTRSAAGAYASLPLRRPWTAAEDDALASWYGEGAPDRHPVAEIAESLHRPVASIDRRAAIIGLAPLRPARPAPAPAPAPSEGAPWTAEEDVALRTAWTEGEPAAEIALALQRPASEVRARAERLHLRSPAPARPSRSGAWWTDAEDQRIRDELAVIGPARLAAAFGRTVSEVKTRARIITTPLDRRGRLCAPCLAPTAEDLAELPDIV